jgi:hypothetical protein
VGIPAVEVMKAAGLVKDSDWDLPTGNWDKGEGDDTEKGA